VFLSQNKIEELKEKITELEVENKHLNKKLLAADKRLSNSKVAMKNELKHYQEEIENLQLQYRSKDKECRLLTLKLKEFQRLTKFKHLKPLDLDLIPSEVPSTRAQSTMRNHNSELFQQNPKFVNKKLKKDDIVFDKSRSKAKRLDLDNTVDLIKSNNM
jgi:septal ring factor EnvC (AmiA/AmiB activator)